MKKTQMAMQQDKRLTLVLARMAMRLLEDAGFPANDAEKPRDGVNANAPGGHPEALEK